MSTVRFIYTRFTEDDIVDGDIPHDDEHVEIVDNKFTPRYDGEYGGRVAWAASIIVDEGLTFDGSCDWAVDPDGSYTADYATGERIATTAHLEGFAPSEIRAIVARVQHLNA